MAKQRPADPSADDAAADAQSFRAAVRDVTPLAQTPLAGGLAAPRPRRRKGPPRAAENLDESMPLLGAMPPDEAAQDAVTREGALFFQRGGVRVQVMRRLRRGLFPIDDELDLHGLS